MVIQSDASLQGWGAVSQGRRIQGRWSFKESAWHINCLELKAATLAIQTFLNGQQNLQVHLQLDNTLAVAYINHKGGTHSPQLMRLTSILWGWCLDHQIQVLATHLPGVCNVQADHLSRHLTDRCDWKLRHPSSAAGSQTQKLGQRTHSIRTGPSFEDMQIPPGA